MQSRHWLSISTGVILGVLVGVVVILLGGKLASDAKYSVRAETGALAPDFELDSIGEGRIRLSRLLGKPVMINFWATWCVPCKEELPIIQEVYDLQQGRLEVVAVNADEPDDRVEQYTSESNITFPILLDPGGLVQNLYHIRGYPTTYFIDKKGIVQFQHIGSLTKDQLMKYLVKIGVNQ